MRHHCNEVRNPCPGSLVLPGRGHPVCARDLGRRHDVQDLGHSDGEITLATASIGIAWSLKPFWAAFLDMFKTKKFFVLLMEVVMACCAAPSRWRYRCQLLQITIAVLWVMAFASATQDICVDGVYIHLTRRGRGQAKYIGVQGVFWAWDGSLARH